MFRKMLLLGSLIAAVVVYAGVTAEQTWSGKISDSMCGAKHAAAAEHGNDMKDAACVTACVKKGAKYVFVADGKVYSIENQNLPDLAANAGRTVKLTGDMNGDSIKVSRIEAAKM